MNFDTVGTIIAIFIGICALGISVWQGIEIRKNYRLSVIPHISFSGFWVKGHRYVGLVIINNGLGPARITNISIFHNGIPIEGKNLTEKIKLAMNKSGKKGTGRSFDYVIVSCPNNEILSPSEELPIVHLGEDDKDDENNITLLRTILKEIKIEVNYESLYQEKYTSHYSDDE